MSTTLADDHTASTPLHSSTLAAYGPDVQVPEYDRLALRPSVVHIGVGGFHRAHQGVYFDSIAQEGISMDWGVVGVGLHTASKIDLLSDQDGLYTVVERSPEGNNARIVGSLIRVLFADGQPDDVVGALSDSRTRVVTLTITADGYYLDAATGELDTSSPDIEADLGDPATWTTALGYLTQALGNRKAAGSAPFTVLSCDNVPDNGRVTRTALVTFAGLRDPDLGRWIDDNVAFPSSMVDRITPITTDEDCSALQAEFGIDDLTPVMTEPFIQWVIEDDFCNGRPPLDQVGAQFVTDVAPYKLIKSRMLNATHCALGYVGLLLDFDRVDEAMKDSCVHDYVEQLMTTELSTTPPPAPGMDVADYQKQLMKRLTNPHISDQLTRLAGRGSTKMPCYLLPAVDALREDHAAHPLLTFAVACWVRFLRALDSEGRTVDIKDARSDELIPIARAAGSDATTVLAIDDIFGELGTDRLFVDAVSADLRLLDEHGVRAALQRKVA